VRVKANRARIAATNQFSRHRLEQVLMFGMQAGTAEIAAFSGVTLANQAAQRIKRAMLRFGHNQVHEPLKARGRPDPLCFCKLSSGTKPEADSFCIGSMMTSAASGATSKSAAPIIACNSAAVEPQLCPFVSIFK
jgi:hypothetical protein